MFKPSKRRLKLRVKLKGHEFEALGFEDVVQASFEKFLDCLAEPLNLSSPQTQIEIKEDKDVQKN